MSFQSRRIHCLVICFSLVALTSGLAYGQSGHVLDGVGPGDQALGGATTALPVDAIGSTHRNPASILGLPCSEIGFGMAVFAPVTEMSSRVDANAFGTGVPPVTMQGSTSSDIDFTPMPSMGIVRQSEDGSFAYGMGAFGVGGFGTDFPASATNPILTPQAPNGFGFGAVQSSFQMLQISMPLALQVSDHVAVGFAPNFSWASLGVTPFAAATPDDANRDGFYSYPNGSRDDARWGLGFQVGLYYTNECTGWNVGVMYQSTTWLDEFQINSQDELGQPRVLTMDLDYPSRVSLGVAYTGFAGFDLSTELRYIDYGGTSGFGDAGYDPTGAVTGFGWDSIWVAALGVQYHVNDCLKLRMGYTFNQSPLDASTAFFNVPAPGIVQHHLSGGFAWTTPHDWILSLAYHHGFENSNEGPWMSPLGPIPGTSVRADLSTNTMVMSASKRF